MSISASQPIKASRQQVWDIITDIENCVGRISGIKAVEVLENPSDGVVGLKWKETREMFGKDAIETMWISEAEAPNWYVTTAHNHGAVYNSRLELTDSGDDTLLTMSFKSTPQTFTARLMSMMTFLFSGALKKMIKKDLEDIRDAAEKNSA